MRRTVLTAAALAALFMSLIPSQARAASAYEMFGGGQLDLTSGGGVPACPPTCNPNASSVFSFQTLPINGFGVLADHQVAAQYDCPSSVLVAGDTTSIFVDWTFECTKTAALPTAIGPDIISGHFSTIERGFPLFAGEFVVNGVSTPSTCSGVPFPSDFTGDPLGGVYITQFQFVGECSSVAG